VSSTGTYAPAGAITAPTTNLFVAVVILVLFVLSAAVSAARKDIGQGFDEVAHTSYVAHIQATGDAWPVLERMRLLDPQTFQFSGAANYLNHPPFFYALLAALGPKLEGQPRMLIVDRLIDVAIAGVGFAVLLGLGLAARLTRAEFYAYAVPLACIPVLAPIAGAVNNDDLAFLGGAIAILGAWQRVASGGDRWLALALVGVIVAGWTKLTGLLLTAALVGCVIAYLNYRGRMSISWTIAAAVAFAIAAMPYLVYVWQYGSPTPQTPAQIALIADGARAAGWSDLPRHSFFGYVVYFIGAFVADWMPALVARGAFNNTMLVIPVAAIGCALGGVALSLRRFWLRKETPLDVLVLTGAVAIGATFVIHVTYSYGRYAATGWLMDAYPRYYLPLIAIVPLACLSLLAGVASPRGRGALLAFLVAGPIVFRLFGAPLG
jgi:hypothetical protein